MKTTSLKRSKKQNSTTRRALICACFVCVLVALIQWFFPSAFFNIVYSVSIPFIDTRDALGGEFASIEALTNSKESLATQNDELKKDLSAVSVKLLSMQALETENQALQNIVATKQSNSKPDQTVFAEVIEQPPFSPYDSFIISSGSNSGITTGNPVFADDGTPLGTIEAVFPSSAKVLLFSSDDTAIPVEVGEKKFETIALGKGGGNFSMKIPVGNAPEVGDAVYIPQFGDAVLGTVESVSAGATDAFADVLVSYPENIFEISYVTIDTSSHFQIATTSDEATTTLK